VDALNLLQQSAGFVAHIITSGRISTIDEWLGKNAKGLWSIKFEGDNATGDAKKYAVRFAEKSDYALFRTRFMKAKPA
jgi:hypothetical protein